MAGYFKKREAMEKRIEELEEKYKEDGPEFEKNDKLAIFIASFLAFVPILLLMLLVAVAAFLLR